MATRCGARTRSPRSATAPRCASRASPSSRTRSGARASARASAWTARPSWPRCCTTRSRTPAPRSRRSSASSAAEVAALVDGVTKLVQDPLREPGGAPGRELPQADRLDVERHPRAGGQARRPAPQHAHARLHDQAEADPEGQGDARGLRAARPPPRHQLAQVGARGPRVRTLHPQRYGEIQQMVNQRRPDREAFIEEAGAASSRRAARGRRHHRRRDHRPGEALLLDLREDDPEGQGVQRDLRPHRDAGARGLGEGLLRGGRHHPLAVEAAARALQGLHRDAQAQHVPVAAHDGHRARGQAARDPDPHVRDAPPRPSSASPRTGSTRRAAAATSRRGCRG